MQIIVFSANSTGYIYIYFFQLYPLLSHNLIFFLSILATFFRFFCAIVTIFFTHFFIFCLIFAYLNVIQQNMCFVCFLLLIQASSFISATFQHVYLVYFSSFSASSSAPNIHTDCFIYIFFSRSGFSGLRWFTIRRYCDWPMFHVGGTVCVFECDSLKEGDKARVWEACVFEGFAVHFCIHTTSFPNSTDSPSSFCYKHRFTPVPLPGSKRGFERGVCRNGGAQLKELDCALGDRSDNEMVGGRKTNFLTRERERY